MDRGEKGKGIGVAVAGNHLRTGNGVSIASVGGDAVVVTHVLTTLFKDDHIEVHALSVGVGHVFAEFDLVNRSTLR